MMAPYNVVSSKEMGVIKGSNGGFSQGSDPMMAPWFLVRFDIIWFKFTSTTLYHIFIYKAMG